MLLILISLFLIVVEGRLQAHFPMGEQSEELVEKGKETDTRVMFIFQFVLSFRSWSCAFEQVQPNVSSRKRYT